MLKRIFQVLLDQILPEKCLGCKKDGIALCETCILQIRDAEREPGRHIHAIFDYRDPIIKRAVWQLKYSNRKSIAKILGSVMYDRMLEEFAGMKTLSIGDPILVIPIPLSKKRMRERSYNQSELLARYMTESSPEKLFELDKNIIVKVKDTPPQARIVNRNKRLANIRDAFDFKDELARAQVRGRTIIILDDVTTTGGTIHEIMHLLEKAKAKKVIGLALAH